MGALEQRVLAEYDLAGAELAATPSGLINKTFVGTLADRRFILQRVSAIFPPEIHDNIEAVTACLERAKLLTPRLVRTRDGRLFVTVPGEAGVFRVMTFIEGTTFDVIQSAAQAREAGALLGRVHRALDALDHPFAHVRKGAHDTPLHLSRLEEAVAEPAHQAHRLYGPVSALAVEIAAAARALPPLPPLRRRVCHGDPKLNNVLFAAPDDLRALCLIDLDTVGPLPLAHELGDAWRSWCNRNGEDEPVAAFDLDVFAASLEGYRDAHIVEAGDRGALLLSVEWISLELAARFAADALHERYFGWDPARFPGRAEHNLVRAQGQWSLHCALVASRGERERLLEQ
jgi:Ser/Thr protein kinase RdoA (MazF antagonist)